MAPLVSFLLPTRNRLEFLEQAVQTVLRQDDGDWEIVISDNDSEQDVAGFLTSLGADERIRYVRTPSFVPVTENWNNALAHSTGRHVLMLGDDDGLMPGYVARLRELVERYDAPDVVYTGSYLLAYPGVMPGEPAGYLWDNGHAMFLRGRRDPFVLDMPTRRAVVEHALHFRMRYGFNMQLSTISRRLINELDPRGPYYQSAFPDFYATNVSFLTARSVVVEPRPLVVIGVTPKSYGFFHAHAQEEAGKQFLGAVNDEQARARLAAAMLPGSNINAGWLSALESIRARYPDLLPADPNHRRFRLLQATHTYEGYFFDGTISADELATFEQHLRGWERGLGRTIARAARHCRPLPRKLRWGISTVLHWVFIRQYPAWNPPKVRGHRSMLDVYESAERVLRSTRV